MANNKGGTIAAIILGILLLLAGVWGFNQMGQVKQLTTDKNQMTAELKSLEDLKLELQSDVDSLQVAYADLSTENGTLKGNLDAAEEKIKQKQAVLVKYKSASKSAQGEVSSLKEQIAALIASKDDLLMSINTLQEENASLRGDNERLTGELEVSRTEADALKTMNTAIQEEVDKLTDQTFRASAFKVTPFTKGDRVNAKSRRVRSVEIEFDLTNVPPKHRGTTQLYMVISDDKGTPIKLKNPIQASVRVNGQPMDILAAEQKEMYLEESQRISFKHDLADKLDGGFYRASVYSENSLLGASVFQLK